MTDRLLYFIGAPGSGKSTLVAKMTEHLTREHVTASDANPVAHDKLLFLDGVVAGAEIGVRRERFGGTDALPASIIEKAIPWIETQPYELIIAEGARLANKRFLTAAAKAGYEVHLGMVDHADVAEWRSNRAIALKHAQNPAWVKGRYTASVNLATYFADKQKLGVKVYIGHPDTLLSDMEHLLG